MGRKIRNNILIVVCISHVAAVEITFSVDISNEGFIIGCVPVISGSFDNWETTHELNYLGDGIGEITLDLIPNSYYEYKFGICASELEILESGTDCTNTNEDNTNRYVDVADENLILDTYYYGSCEISGGWDLVWSDEFDTNNIDLSKWNYDIGNGNWGWGNGEEQYYTNNSNNSYIEDGKLIIKAMLQNYGSQNYTSARLNTKFKGDWTHGKFVIRAKMPAGTGTWPAIWMLPTSNTYGGWPNSGEIDIMEAVGHVPGAVYGTAHMETYNWFDGAPPPSSYIYINDLYTEFHDYIVEWEENSIKWYVDDTHYFTYSNDNQGWETWPFDQNFHILLNIAIGGTWGGQQGIDNSIFPVQMEVEYVRVYQHPSPPNPEVTFLVDMQNEEVDDTGIYVVGTDEQFDSPMGILMSDTDNDNIWSVTVPLTPGTYDYKFRNGYYDYWDSPGWEDSNNLIDCSDLPYREFIMDHDLVLGPFCFSSCEACISLSNNIGLTSNSFTLLNAYPNPFNPIASINYSVHEYTNVKIIIYDINGNEVEELVNNNHTVGKYELSWDATNYPSGLYFVQSGTHTFTQTQKLMLVK